MAFATKKPITVEYHVFNGSNHSELNGVTGGWFRQHEGHPGEGEVYDYLHDTWIKVYAGQVIIKGSEGEFYPHAVPLFYENYDLVNDKE